MKRLAVIVTASVAVIGVLAGQAVAAAPHLKGRNPVVFTDNGLTLTAQVSYAGLGNFDTLQVLDATAQPTSTCTNPAGATQPPGQNPNRQIASRVNSLQVGAWRQLRPVNADSV